MQYIKTIRECVISPSDIYGADAEPKLKALLEKGFLPEYHYQVVHFRPPKDGDEYVAILADGSMRVYAWFNSNNVCLDPRLIVVTTMKLWWE